METWIADLPARLSALWWPFCRLLAVFAMLPMLGEQAVPMRWRVAVALLLAIIALPVAQPVTTIAPLSLHGMATAAEQALIGVLIGLSFHLVVAVVMLVGYLVSSQMGLAMAAINDPTNGEMSNAVSILLYFLSILLFFAIDGHLIVIAVVFSSFQAWPVGAGLPAPVLTSLLYAGAWLLSAALLLALPVVFSTFVVQFGLGLLNRAAPAFNLFSLGFSVTTAFGLVMLAFLLPTLPTHYLALTEHVLGLLNLQTRSGHG